MPTVANKNAEKAYVLALDQGTTSSRAILFDSAGSPERVAQVALPVQFPQAGWVEQDPELIWSTQFEAMKQAVAGIDPSAIAAIGISNQRETTVVWDRESGTPLAPAIVWQCRRSETLCEELIKAGKQDFVRKKTGVVIDPYFSASKIRWLYEEYEDVRNAIDTGTAACGTVDSWLLYRLSERRAFVTEASNASRTMLFGIESLQWDEELFSLWGLPSSCMAEVKHSAGRLTSTSLLGPEIPICGVLGDQQAALLGHGCVTQGSSKCTFGTGAFLLLHAGSSVPRSDSGMLSTVAWTLPGASPLVEFALEGSIFVAGSAVQWLRDEMGLISTAAESEEIAAAVTSSGSLVFVPSFTGLGAPHWNAAARGALFGLSRDTSKGQIVRACLEGVAHQLADLMEDAHFSKTAHLRVDGGMTANSLFNQMLADLSGIVVERPSFLECTALGAARIAALGAGMVQNLEQAVTQLAVAAQEDSVYEPQVPKDAREISRKQWQEAVRRLLA